MFEKTQAYYDAVYASKDYAAESRKVRALVERHKRSGGRDLLDVACGTGSHMVHLRRSYRVEGLDLDPEMLALARRRVKGATFHRGDMRSFRLGKTFDAVVCLFGSIGYARTLKGLDAAASTLALHLKPGGVLLVEPWITPEAFIAGHTRADAAKVGRVSLARLAKTWRRGRLSVLEFRYVVASPQGFRHLSERHELGLFTLGEYRRAFERAGLKVRTDSKGLTGRGLIVGVKPLSPSRSCHAGRSCSKCLNRPGGKRPAQGAGGGAGWPRKRFSQSCSASPFAWGASPCLRPPRRWAPASASCPTSRM